jgi:hypothetical protein
MMLRNWSLFMLLIPFAASANVDANTLLADSDHARGGGLPGIFWTITIRSLDDDGETLRTMAALASEAGSRVEYTEPAKMRGQRIVMQGRNMWFERPGLQRPVPLSPRQRLIGAAANGDVAATRYALDYDAEIAGHDVLNGEDCTVLALSARGHNATYDKIRYWVADKRHVGVKAEFYTVSGKLFKAALFDYSNEILFEGKKIPFISRMTITDAIQKDHVTVLQYSDVRIKKVDPSLFELNQ